MYRTSRLCSLAAPLLLCCLASCFKEPPIYTAQTEITPDGTVIKTPRLISVAQLHREAAAPGPRVHVEGDVHDFGRLDPLTSHEHSFVIRNVGDGPLELTEGPTTCKCTMARLNNRTLAPGEMTTVAVRFNTGRDLEYNHSATIYTNDPRQKVVQLKIKGEVEALLRCEPPELVFSRIEPGQTASASTLVLSQVWDDLELTEVTPARPGITCTWEDASPEDLQALHATSAKRLTVTLPDDLEEGYLSVPVQIVARCRGCENPTEADCELHIQAKVLRRLCVYGPDVDVKGTILMGRITQGQGASLKLLLKLRDPEKNLIVRQIKTNPDFLQVRVEPHEIDQQADVGLYDLYIDLPKDAPTFRLAPNKLGLIRMEFDHPRVGHLELPVDLIVAPREAEEY